MTMPSWLKWLAGTALVALAGLALILHKLSGSKALASAAVNAIEAAHQPHIDALNEKIKVLSNQQVVDQDAVEKAQRAVLARKQDLRLVYGHTGLTPAEINQRLSGMKI